MAAAWDMVVEVSPSSVALVATPTLVGSVLLVGIVVRVGDLDNTCVLGECATPFRRSMPARAGRRKFMAAWRRRLPICYAISLLPLCMKPTASEHHRHDPLPNDTDDRWTVGVIGAFCTLTLGRPS